MSGQRPLPYHLARYPQNRTAGCSQQKKQRPNIYVKCINGLPQVREVDLRLNTGDFQQGSGLQIPPKRKFLYGECKGKRIVLPEDHEVVECFKNKTKDRLCIVNGYELATQRPYVQAIPRYCLFDQKGGEQLYEILEDVDGNKVICVKDERRVRDHIDTANRLGFRLYTCLTDDKKRYFSFERRDVKKPKRQLKRVCVQDSCNAIQKPKNQCCCNAKQLRNLIYEQRKGHFESKTKYACNQRPRVNRVW